MAAQPYMRPAIERAARNIGSQVQNAESNEELAGLLVEEIKDEAKRIVPVDTGKLKASIEVTVEAGGSVGSSGGSI